MTLCVHAMLTGCAAFAAAAGVRLTKTTTTKTLTNS
jgi:hypothetical protein